MKKFFAVALLALLCFGYAHGQESQRPVGSKGNTLAGDPAVISGHYEIEKVNKAKGVTEHINVNYALSAAPFRQVMNIVLNTANPTMFHADITDANGAKVMHWQPAAKSHLYNETLNFSQLVPGTYKLDIYSELNEAIPYSITFQKEK